MSSPKPIRLDEWLTEIEKLSRARSADGFSRRDLQQVLGVSESPAGVKLRQWFDLGLIEFAGNRHEMAIDGRPRMIPVYRPKGKVKAKK